MIEAQKHDLSRGYVNQLFKEHFFRSILAADPMGRPWSSTWRTWTQKKKQIDEAFKSRFH